METFTIDLDGPVHVADFGGRGRPLVLIHGLGGSHLNWASSGPLLADHFRVLALDLIGFGRTPRGQRRSTVQSNQALLDRFLREHLGEPAFLAGNSMGGLISLMEAGLNPGSVAGLVLVNAAIPQPVGSSLDPRVAAIFGTLMTPGLGELYLRGMPLLRTPEQRVAEMISVSCAQPHRIPDEILQLHVDSARQWPLFPGAAQAYLEAARSLMRILLRRSRFDGVVRAVRTPTLLLAGARDRLIPRVAAERLAKLRPDWTFEPLANIGHLPQLEDPHGFTHLVARWAKQVATSESLETAPSGIAGGGAS